MILTLTRSRPKSTADVGHPTILSWTSLTRCSSEYAQPTGKRISSTPISCLVHMFHLQGEEQQPGDNRELGKLQEPLRGMERRAVDWSSRRHPLRSAGPETLQTVRVCIFFLTICLFYAQCSHFFSGSWVSSPTLVNMCQTYSSSLSSSSLAPSSHVPSSRASSTHPFSPPRQVSSNFEHIVKVSYSQVRSIIADYAVVLTLVIFVTFDHAFNLATPKLTVPTELKVQESSSFHSSSCTFCSQLGQTCATGGYP